VLTVAAGMPDRPEVATAALQELRRAQPNISLAWIANALPWKRRPTASTILEAFRRRGWTSLFGVAWRRGSRPSKDVLVPSTQIEE